ncbi:MAG: hypothetical protein R2834_09770 [Rhodothermales bacterium]
MMTTLSQHIRRIDGIVFLLGLAGYAAFALLMPRVATDGAAVFTRPESELIESATRFLIDQGYETEGLTWYVHPRRDPAVLDTLQKAMGRQRALETVRAGAVLPAFHWFVRAELPAPTVEGQGNIRIGESNATEWFEMRLDDRGHVWWFNSSVSNRVFQAVNRNVLFQAIPDTGRTATLFQRLASLPDSTLLGALLFNLRDSLDRPGNPPRDTPPGERPAGNERGPLRLTPLQQGDAVRLARIHLNQLVPPAYGFVVDTLHTRNDGAAPLPLPRHIARSRAIQFAYEPERASAVVAFKGTDPTTGLPMKADLSMTAGGLLLGAEIAYAPPTPASAREDDYSFSLSTELVSLLLLISIGIFVLVLFFRRLSARLIDVKSALQDALLGGVFLATIVFVSMGKDMITADDDSWSVTFIWIGTTLLAGSIGGFMTFIVSSATDSLARMTWPEKLQALTYARNVNFYNVPTGLSLLRGLGVAGIILGLLVALLGLLPGVPTLTESGDTDFLRENSLFATGLYIGVRGWSTQLLLLTVLLGVGSEVMRRFPSKRVFFIAMPILLTLTNLSPYKLWPDALTLVPSALIALVVAFTFWQYDFVACFVGLMAYGMLWDTAPGWLPAGAPDIAESIATLACIGGVGLLGFVGLISRRTSPPDTFYRPAYIQELAQQERLRGELENARAGRPPIEMPRMPGVDIAAFLHPRPGREDYYDFIRIDEHRLALVVGGDVSGQGDSGGAFHDAHQGFLRALCRKKCLRRRTRAR